MDIGSRLDTAMKKAGFDSQSALARASGVPQPTINRILKGGGRRGPETDTIRKLAAACEVRFEWLMEGVGEVSHDEVSPTDNGEALDQMVELVRTFRLLPKEARISLMGYARNLAEEYIAHGGAVSSGN